MKFKNTFISIAVLFSLLHVTNYAIAQEDNGKGVIDDGVILKYYPLGLGYPCPTVLFGAEFIRSKDFSIQAEIGYLYSDQFLNSYTHLNHDLDNFRISIEPKYYFNKKSGVFKGYSMSAQFFYKQSFFNIDHKVCRVWDTLSSSYYPDCLDELYYNYN